LIFHQVIVLMFHSVKVRDLHKPNRSSIHINCAIYVTHTHTHTHTHTAYILSHRHKKFKSHCITHCNITHKQNINTPNNIMCTAILIQFRRWTTEIQTRLLQHSSVSPSQSLGTSSVRGRRWPPYIEWLLIYWITSCGQATNKGPPVWQSGERLTLLTIKT
jgi:hypothetical protein